jgi:hypothetical protein
MLFKTISTTAYYINPYNCTPSSPSSLLVVVTVVHIVIFFLPVIKPRLVLGLYVSVSKNDSHEKSNDCRSSSRRRGKGVVVTKKGKS